MTRMKRQIPGQSSEVASLISMMPSMVDSVNERERVCPTARFSTFRRWASFRRPECTECGALTGRGVAGRGAVGGCRPRCRVSPALAVKYPYPERLLGRLDRATWSAGGGCPCLRHTTSWSSGQDHRVRTLPTVPYAAG